MTFGEGCCSPFCWGNRGIVPRSAATIRKEELEDAHFLYIMFFFLFIFIAVVFFFVGFENKEERGGVQEWRRKKKKGEEDTDRGHRGREKKLEIQKNCLLLHLIFSILILILIDFDCFLCHHRVLFSPSSCILLSLPNCSLLFSSSRQSLKKSIFASSPSFSRPVLPPPAASAGRGDLRSPRPYCR